jgi:SnoaL-like domain
MDTREIVTLYYEGWTAKRGDLSDVPLADAFVFKSPVAHIEGADAYRQVAREAGNAITKFELRYLFVDGPMACAILDWQMAPLSGPLAAAEILEVGDGWLVRSELIYDAQELRKTQ